MDKPPPTTEELIGKVAGHNVGSPAHWRAHFELHKRAVEEAGKPVYRWAVIAGVAAILSVLLALVQVFLR